MREVFYGCWCKYASADLLSWLRSVIILLAHINGKIFGIVLSDVLAPSRPPEGDSFLFYTNDTTFVEFQTNRAVHLMGGSHHI